MKRRLLVIACSLATSAVMLVRPAEAAPTGCPIAGDEGIQWCVDGVESVCADPISYCDGQIPQSMRSLCRTRTGSSCQGLFPYPAASCNTVMYCMYDNR